MNNKMKIAIIFLIAVAILGSLTGAYLITEGKAQAEAPDKYVTTSGVFRSGDASALPGGSSILVRFGDGIAATFDGVELQPGYAYTLWWVIFNHPEECKHPTAGLSRCGEADVLAQPLGETPVRVSVQLAAGNVVGESGTANFGASLREGEIPAEPGRLVFGAGLIDAQEAEVHLVVRDHGPAIPGMVEAQITTFGGGCTPETEPTGVGPFGPNPCSDVQFAAHVPSDSR